MTEAFQTTEEWDSEVHTATAKALEATSGRFDVVGTMVQIDNASAEMNELDTVDTGAGSPCCGVVGQRYRR